jgi:predicted nucleic acid-binding Zn ribbon protein
MGRVWDEDARWLSGEIRQEGRRPPQPIAEVLSRLMSRRGYANVQIAQEWVEVWKQAAGELAARSRPARFGRGVLEVVVQDSVTVQELAFRKKQLLAAITELVPQYKLRNLRFKVGEVS